MRHGGPTAADRKVATPVIGTARLLNATESVGAVVDTANDPLLRVPGSARCEQALPQPRRAPSAFECRPVPDEPRARWIRRYQLKVVSLDFAAAAVGALLGYLLRFGAVQAEASARVAAFALPVAWCVTVWLDRGYEARYLGAGHTEFSRVFRAAVHVTVLIALASYALHADVAREFVLLALPFAFAIDIVGRYGLRKRLHHRRAQGQAIRAVLAVGDSAAVIAFTRYLMRDRYAGMSVCAACLTDSVPEDVAALAELGVAQHGDVDNILDAVTRAGADTVAVVSHHLGSEQLRWIAWQLEGTDIELVVSPGLTEITGRRLHMCPVAGLPLLHVDQPEFRGFRFLLKELIDLAVTLLAVLLLLPVFAAIYVAVRLSGPGPAIFRQTRVGRNGRTFTMLKFRSMEVDAEARLADVQAANEHAEGPLFKMHDDPRVTPIGRALRRYSLDELPQLFNVLAGHMSLVGPRPPLPSEVLQYEDAARRRLLVKPGLTGLWQISGRSDLSWEESVRLDLRYVENWSPGLDLLILWKTAFAVLRGSGAY